MPTPEILARDVADGIFEMHARLALRTRSTDALAEAMTTRALDGAEISANGRFLLFSAIRHALQFEMPSADVRRLTPDALDEARAADRQRRAAR